MWIYLSHFQDPPNFNFFFSIKICEYFYFKLNFGNRLTSLITISLILDKILHKMRHFISLYLTKYCWNMLLQSSKFFKTFLIHSFLEPHFSKAFFLFRLQYFSNFWVKDLWDITFNQKFICVYIHTLNCILTKLELSSCT